MAVASTKSPGNPVRMAFDAAFDVTGLAILLGCVLAIAWRIRVNALPERKFSDTPTTLFLLLVVAGNETTRQAIAHGMNALIEASSRAYRQRMERWVDGALE